MDEHADVIQMKTRSKRQLTVVVAALVVLGAAAISGWLGAAVVVIRNETGFKLTNVEIGGDGGEFEAWTQSVPDIPRGETVIIVVTESYGESGLRIRLEANGAAIAKYDIAYLMNAGWGTTTEIVVHQDVTLEATHHSFPSWHWRRVL